MDDPNTKGAVAEQAIVLAATKLHIPVLRPVAEHGRTDLGLEIGGELYRVQVKWGRLSPDGDVIVVASGTSRCTPNGYIRGTYSEHEIELVAVYCGDLDRCFLLPISLVAGKYAIQLRLKPARNGQRACINLAENFDFEGAIAQLGERRHGMAEVVGSSPTSSTSQRLPIPVGSDDFRDHLGYWSERAERGDSLVVTYRGKPRLKVSPANPPQPLWPLPATARHAAYPLPSFAASKAAGASSDRSSASETARSASSAASAPPIDSSRNANARTT